MDAAEAFSKDKDRVADLLDAALFWYRDVLVYQETGEEKHLINLDRKARIVLLAGALPGPALSHRITAVEEAKAALRRNAHPRLLLENLFLRLTSPTEPSRR